MNPSVSSDFFLRNLDSGESFASYDISHHSEMGDLNIIFVLYFKVTICIVISAQELFKQTLLSNFGE